MTKKWLDILYLRIITLLCSKYDKFYIPSQYWEFQMASSTRTFQIFEFILIKIPI